MARDYKPHRPKRYLAQFDTKTFMAKVTARRHELGLTLGDLSILTGIPDGSLRHLAAGRIEAPGAHILVTLMAWMGEKDVSNYSIVTPFDEEDD